MGTREVYEEKLRRGNLHHDPTMNPGLGSARCPRCLSLLNPNSEKGKWTVTPVLHDTAVVAGSGLGGMLSAVHAFNTGFPYIQNRLKGSKRLPFLVGVPLLVGYSAAGAAFGGTIYGYFLVIVLVWIYIKLGRKEIERNRDRRGNRRLQRMARGGQAEVNSSCLVLPRKTDSNCSAAQISRVWFLSKTYSLALACVVDTSTVHNHHLTCMEIQSPSLARFWNAWMLLSATSKRLASSKEP